MIFVIDRASGEPIEHPRVQTKITEEEVVKDAPLYNYNVTTDPKEGFKSTKLLFGTAEYEKYWRDYYKAVEISPDNPIPPLEWCLDFRVYKDENGIPKFSMRKFKAVNTIEIVNLDELINLLDDFGDQIIIRSWRELTIYDHNIE